VQSLESIALPVATTGDLSVVRKMTAILVADISFQNQADRYIVSSR
jgi:hypothetical protein